MSENAPVPLSRTRVLLNELIENTIISRTALMKKMFDPRRDIDAECGYSDVISIEEFKKMYDREGVGHRVVTVWPEETWVQDPMVYENEESDETEFELAFKATEQRLNLFHYMHRVDELSGIGEFGVMLLGLDDGKKLHEAVPGIVEKGKGAGSPAKTNTNKQRNLLFVRVFDQSAAKVLSVETDEQSPRYGQPTMYELDFGHPSTVVDSHSASAETTKKTKVHWTRVVHVADGRQSSEIYGTPRQQCVWNRLMDLRKLMGGSAEMFWKGAFPGYSFESEPDVELSADDIKALREEFSSWSNGLDRFLATSGVKANSLAPQVEDPSNHVIIQIKLLCAAIRVPWRVFIGSEQAQLASDQDRKNFDSRIKVRREKYVTPCLVREVVDRLIMVEVLPTPVGDETNQMPEVQGVFSGYPYKVEWPEIQETSPKEKADIAKAIIEVIARYIQSGANQIIPEIVLLTRILDFDKAEADEILNEAIKRIQEMDDLNEEDPQDDEGDTTAPDQADQKKPQGPPPVNRIPRN
jgi:uncharacterized protein